MPIVFLIVLNTVIKHFLKFHVYHMKCNQNWFEQMPQAWLNHFIFYANW